ncbi:hypothetical protein CGH19_22650 [Vibrio parahaemolyticus]|nr:hypothetical protein CGH19_22650 [Vibrio parahaemolyticus]
MNSSDKEANFYLKFRCTKEIARKLETVNGEINAKTLHLVPPERT